MRCSSWPVLSSKTGTRKRLWTGQQAKFSPVTERLLSLVLPMLCYPKRNRRPSDIRSRSNAVHVDMESAARDAVQMDGNAANKDCEVGVQWKAAAHHDIR